jgi:hypothetical protein
VHIYKHGFPASTPHDEAIAMATEGALALAAGDPTLDGSIVETEIVQTDAHTEAGEYLVRLLLGPDTRPKEDPIEQRRRELLAELADLEAMRGALGRDIDPQLLADALGQALGHALRDTGGSLA